MIYYGKRNNSSKYFLNKLYIFPDSFLIYSVFVRPSIFFPWQFSVSLCVSPPINIITLTLSCYLPLLSTHQYFPWRFPVIFHVCPPIIFLSLTVSCYFVRLFIHQYSFPDSFLLSCTFVHPSIFFPWQFPVILYVCSSINILSLTVSCYLVRLFTHQYSFPDSFLLSCTFVHPSIFFPWQFPVILYVCPPIIFLSLTVSCYFVRLFTHQYSFPDSFLLSCTFVHPSIFFPWQFPVILYVCPPINILSLTVSCYLVRLSAHHYSFPACFTIRQFIH